MAPHAVSQQESEWIAALASRDADAVARLSRLVRRKLGVTIGRRDDVTDADLDDFAQDACLRVLASLDSFRGDARFETWVSAVAVRVALTELRKKRWTAERTGARLAEFERALVEREDAGERAERGELLDALHAAIRDALTPRQKQVILAELEGIPLVRIAERLDSKPNAVYKVGHDARKRLRAVLEQRGFDADALHALAGGERER